MTCRQHPRCYTGMPFSDVSAARGKLAPPAPSAGSPLALGLGAPKEALVSTLVHTGAEHCCALNLSPPSLVLSCGRRPPPQTVTRCNAPGE